MKKFNFNAFLIKGLVGGAVFFVLGFLIYGVMLSEYMATQMNPDASLIQRGSEMVWWAMILGNVGLGLLIALVSLKAEAKTWQEGAKLGALTAFLYDLTTNMMSYSMMTLTTLQSMFVDLFVCTLIGAVMGLVMVFVAKEK